MSFGAFDNIVLEDTFVFSWHRAHDLLTFNVLASLLQSHPEASPPASRDWACYRPAVIRRYIRRQAANCLTGARNR